MAYVPGKVLSNTELLSMTQNTSVFLEAETASEKEIET